MITLQQGTIYMGTAAPASGGGGSGDAVWGSITGTLADQTDLATALAGKQDVLTAGTGIDITNNVISATGGATSVENKNTAVGATNPLNFWEGTSAEYESGGGSQTWYNWLSGGGLSFIASTLPGTINGGILEYGNGTYLLASTVNLATDGCYISTDNGGSWSNTNIDVSSQYQYGLTVGGIAYGNNTWVITTRNDKYCLYSEDDAQTWSLVNLPGTGNSWICAFGNNVFIAIDQFTGECLISSDNGKTWAQGASISAQYYNIFKFCGDKFYALASSTNTLYYTTNGQSWSTITLPASKSWTDIVYGNNKLVISSFEETNNIIYSEDSGQTWNTVSISIKPNKLSFGNNMFVACGNGISTAVYTNDVTNWTSITLPNDASAICYGNNRFVYVNLFNTNAGYGVASVGAECFTTDSEPTTSSQVYSAPNTTSALTITAVGTGTITLSDTNTYNYNASGNQTTTQSVGEAHPDWICMIEGVGIKKGSTTIASIAPTVDQTYNASSTNAQSGVAVASGIADSLGIINTQLESIIAQGD